MNTEKITGELCVEVYATNNEETTMIVREIIGKKGVHETYMNIYDKLMNMGKDKKWEVVAVADMVSRNASKETVFITDSL